MSEVKNTDLLLSFLVGIVCAGILGWLYGLFKGYVEIIQSATKKQKVFHETLKTPQEVVDEANAAWWKLCGCIVLGSGLVLYTLGQGPPDSIPTYLFDLILNFFGLVVWLVQTLNRALSL